MDELNREAQIKAINTFSNVLINAFNNLNQIELTTHKNHLVRLVQITKTETIKDLTQNK